MSFYDTYLKHRDLDVNNFCENVNDIEILKVIQKDNLNMLDFLTLLSPKAEKFLEKIAKKSSVLTINNFGKTMLLYTPLYIGNFCVNQCLYCSFNIKNNIKRKKLTFDEIEDEAKIISSKGLRHILILTGESKQHTPVSYIKKAVEILTKYFRSITIEIYPLDENEYKELIECGVDGLTIYQEVYDEDVYSDIHLSGPKRDYRYRIEAPERACKVRMRSVNIGALLGLADWRKEIFYTALHANYLQDKYLDTEISISLPRIRPHIGQFQPKSIVHDRSLVQIMTALRLFMPRLGITISTREKAEFRDNIIGLGVTKMSAGSTTEVGGHSQLEQSESQFDISDNRSVLEMKNVIYKKGYQPIFKDWQYI